MIRTFVAVELGDELRRSLIGLQDALRRDLLSGARNEDQARNPHSSMVRVQWTRPESLHVTLKFLGEIEETQVDRIRTALTEALNECERFTVDVDGVGTFPDARAPRVIWAGLKATDGEHPLIRLAAVVEQALVPLGFPTEKRPFSPHLTLARVKDGGRAAAQALRASDLISMTRTTGQIGTLAVEEVVLMRSDLRPTGSVYTRLFDVPLKGNR
jgi:2'-5' RNA ligase